MRVWVTRDDDFDSVQVWGGLKPNKQNGGYFGRGGDRHVMRGSFKGLRKLFDVSPRKGTCKQYELTLEEVK